MRGILNSILLFIFLLACSCNSQKELVITGRVEVMELPYPESHVLALQKPNRIVDTLYSGTLIVVDEWAEKDFYVYEVRTFGGDKGYVFGGDNIKFSKIQGTRSGE